MNSVLTAGKWPSLPGLLRQTPFQRISDLEPRVASMSYAELRRYSLSLRYRAFSGEPLQELLPEAYCLMREATSRSLGMRHYDVQLQGGIAMHDQSIAEMQTGEGKTLTATLPLYLFALAGQGSHLATANDYLARRDATTMRPAYSMLGFSVGIIESNTAPPRRHDAYACDITYAAAREFGFDFLRDRLAQGASVEQHGAILARMLGQAEQSPTAPLLQRQLQFVLVDEADSILIDEARTPLIVSSLPGNSEDAATALHYWAAEAAPQFENSRHFEYDHKCRSVTLNAPGRRQVRELNKDELLDPIALIDFYQHVEVAIRVLRDFHRDQHYVVRDGEIVIVDENTGRLAEGRKWRDGIHQAIEAKEGVEVTFKTGEAARVTVQDFFLQYRRLAGMTGTASNSRRELKRIYGLNTRVISTNRPERRQRLPDRVFGNADAKWQAIVQEVSEFHLAGRPVLIGTRSIDKSERLSQLLDAACIEHDVLNAHRHADEAAIVSAAGEKGRVTVATNMAGRGTDIKLGAGVSELGGLHVICTELHESSRIDRQLIGRCARQGDPGSFRQFMSLDDDIVRAGCGPRVAARLCRLGSEVTTAFDHFASTLRRAQARIEREHFRQRRMLLYHEKQRREVQREMGQDPYLDATM